MTAPRNELLPRRIGSLLVASAVLTSLVGCAPDPADDWNAEYKAAWTADATLLSDPVIAGDVVLAYVASGEGEEAVVAWDLGDGEETSSASWESSSRTWTRPTMQCAHTALRIAASPLTTAQRRDTSSPACG